MDSLKQFRARIKLNIACPNFRRQLRILKNEPGNKWLLIGTPIHNNLGDHLIAATELAYLRKLNKDVSIFEIPTEMFLLYGDRIKMHMKPKDIVFINGGGWMGTMWKHDEYLMQNILCSFKEYKTIVFPQTIYYDKSDFEFQTILDKAQNTWRDATKSILCLRDEKSYNYAREYLKIEQSRCLFLPDIALLYQYKQIENSKNQKVLFCLRDDREQILDSLIQKKLEKYIKTMGYDIKYTSTIIKKVVSCKERIWLINKKLDEFKMARLIVTDRLHGMIFAFISGTPCIALDNKTKKVWGVYHAWLENVEKIIFSTNEEELLKQNINKALNKTLLCEKETHQANLLKNYAVLERIIKNDR